MKLSAALSVGEIQKDSLGGMVIMTIEKNVSGNAFLSVSDRRR